MPWRSIRIPVATDRPLKSGNHPGAPGRATCAVNPSGKFVLVANYASGSVASLPIEADGRLGEATSFIQHAGSSVNRQRQEGPHAHGIALDAAGRFSARLPTWGWTRSWSYRLDSATGKLTATARRRLPRWRGPVPRHIALHPDGPLRLCDQ